MVAWKDYLIVFGGATNLKGVQRYKISTGKTFLFRGKEVLTSVLISSNYFLSKSVQKVCNFDLGHTFDK